MAKLLMNGSITEGDWEVLKRGKLASSVAQHDVEIVEMDADKVPPPQSTVLSLGKYEPQNGENVVELPTIGKLYAQCNALSMIALAFERAVLGDNLPKFTYEMCTHVESIPRGKWYVDIETKGDVSAQKPSWDKIISMSITVAETGHTYVLPEEYIQIARIDIQNTLRGIPDSIVMHNGQFDAKYIGVPFDDDTMLKHYAVFPVASHGLKELGKYYLGMDDWDASAKKYLGKLTTKEKNMVAGSPDDVFYTEHGAYYESGVEYTAQNGYERIPRPTLYKYNALDTYVTWLLDELIDERWFLQDGYDYARTTYEMLLEYSHMFLDIEQHGIRFDVPYMEELELELESKQIRLEEELNEIVGYPVNPRSPKQVKEALKERGFRVKSTNESTLETLDDPMAEKILEIRHVSKQLGTYVRGYKNQLIGDYGYPSFKLHASTTGRIGGGGPSLLTLPRDKTMKKMVLPDKGQIIVGADLSQAELRVMACESGDEQLIDAFAPDAGDFFDILLSQAYEDFDRDAEDYGELRTSMKSVVYGCVPHTTKILTQDGYKTSTEVEVGDYTPGIDPESGEAKWTKITHVHHYGEQELYRYGHSNWNVEVTAGHKWVVSPKVKSIYSTPYLYKETQDIVKNDRIVTSRPVDNPNDNSNFTNVEVELLAWLLTDGCVSRSVITNQFSQGKNGERRAIIAEIQQAKPKYVQEIRKLLENVPHTEYHRESQKPGNLDTYSWRLRTEFIRPLWDRAGFQNNGSKVTNIIPFILGLTQEQLEIFVDVFWKAEGHFVGGSKLKVVTQDSGEKLDAFVLACHLTGQRTSVGTHTKGKSWKKVALNLKQDVGTNTAKMIYTKTAPVWCVTTELGSWTMKEGDLVAVTGNTSFSRGVKAISTELGIPQSEAQELVDTFIVPGSDFHKWRTKMANKAVRAEPIDTKFGRRYHNETVRFYNSENIKRTGLSFTSQATANDICLQAAYRIWDSGILKRKYNARIMSTLHDAIYVSCPPEHAEEVGQLIVDTLKMVGSELYGDTVPFESDWDYGSHLGELD